MPDALSPTLASRNRALRVLLVEDNAADAALMEDVFDRQADQVKLSICPGASQMFITLRTPGRPLPDVILLDLHLAGRSGLEGLTELRRDPLLGYLPVTILSGSIDPNDIARAYQEHASAYLVKPFTLAELQAQVDAFVTFWMCCGVIG